MNRGHTDRERGEQEEAGGRRTKGERRRTTSKDMGVDGAHLAVDDNIEQFNLHELCKYLMAVE